MDRVMPPFSPLRVEDLGRSEAGRVVWRLLEPLVHWDRQGRVWTVPANFETDLASVPRLPLAYWLAGGRGNAPAVVHDWMYRALPVTKLEADRLFFEGLEDTGEPGWRAWVMWTAVRVGGRGGWPVDAPIPIAEALSQAP